MKIEIDNCYPREGGPGYYADYGAFRIVTEGDKVVGVYAPNGIEADPATTIMKVVEIDPGIRELVDICGGHCPCAIEWSEDTLCPCKEFREQTEPGGCRCGRFEKVVVK